MEGQHFFRFGFACSDGQTSQAILSLEMLPDVAATILLRKANYEVQRRYKCSGGFKARRRIGSR